MDYGTKKSQVILFHLDRLLTIISQLDKEDVNAIDSNIVKESEMYFRAIGERVSFHDFLLIMRDAVRDMAERITTYAPDRRKRVSAIGNGQVPLAMATAWKLLTGE